MNNTKTNLAAIAAIVIAATLVVGGTFAATTTHPAFAYSKNKGHEGDKNSKNGNTITIQKCEQLASQSGFDNDQEQECANLICTHPGSNATCVSEEEGAAVTPTSTSTSTTSPPVPTQVININPVSCTNTTGASFTGLAGNVCCIIVQNENVTGGGATTGGAQTGTNTCSVTITNTGDITSTPPTGTAVPVSAMSLKASDEKCVNGASGSLNTGTGRTFSVCVHL